MAALKDQANLYSTHSQRLQVGYGLNLITPYLSQGFRVLDVGCGTGNLSLHALDMVGAHGYVYGLDPDESRIQVATNLSKDKQNATFVACKGSDIPQKNVGTFDLAFSNAVLHWMDNTEKQATLQGVYQVLKPGGFFLVQYTTPVPPLTLVLATFMGETERKILENSFHGIPVDKMSELCKEIGYDVLQTEPFESQTKWATLTQLTELYTATFHCGKLDFSYVQDKLKKLEMDIPALWMEDGIFVHRAPINRLILQKPISSVA